MKPMTCQVCGDDVVFGQLLPTGAVCVDCGGVATQEPKAPTDNPKSGAEAPSASSAPHTKTDGVGNPASEAPRAAEEHQESKGEPVPPGSAGDRAWGEAVPVPACGIHQCVRVKGHVGFHTTTPNLAKSEDALMAAGSFIRPSLVAMVAEACDFQVLDLRPFDAKRVSRSEQLSIEVEEWVYGIDADRSAQGYLECPLLLRTPHEIFPARIANNLAFFAGLEVCRFVVVLEHRLPDSDVTLRDIGPSFTPRPGSRDDRAAALNTASGWARSQAARLKAAPPSGYRAAREIS